MMYRSFYDVNHAYVSMLQTILEEEHGMSVRGETMSNELLGVMIRITNAKNNIITLPERKLNYRLMVAEALWNLVPLDYDFMRKFNKRADVFVADQLPGNKRVARWHYGHVLRKEIPRVVDELRKDNFTRRAVYTLPQIHPLVPEGTPPCLMGQQFLYRDGALHCITTMRSNDIWLGMPLDFFQFMLFQHLVAAGAGLPVGSFTLQAASLHLYQRDLALAQEVAKVQRIAPPLAPPTITEARYRQFEEGLLGCALDDILRDRTRYYDIWKPYLDVLRGKANLI